MKSVGEVMAIGRCFEEVLQKAIRMLDVGLNGFVCNDFQFTNMDEELSSPTDKRIFAIAEALQKGYSVDRIHSLTKIDKWFLFKMKNIFDLGEKIRASRNQLSIDTLRLSKKKGFSDKQIAILTESTESEIRKKRINSGIFPYVKKIDTLAAEFPAKTNYLYLTDNADEDDVEFNVQNQVIVLGSGTYHTGSSVEFD